VTDPALPLSPFRAPWPTLPGLIHGFLGRRGGVSGGRYASLNLSYRVGDEPAAVDENWKQVRDHVASGLDLVTMRQVHGIDIVEVSPGVAVDEADGMITTSTGIGLCVLTADCVPILLLAPGAHAVAAVHAGWRGTTSGIVHEVLDRLKSDYAVAASDVYVALGPAIGPCCFEVGAEIVDHLERRWGQMPGAVRRYSRDGVAKARLDLHAANKELLLQAGVEPRRLSTVGGCTRCRSDEYYSHRGATMSSSGAVTGRQLSFIGWAP